MEKLGRYEFENGRLETLNIELNHSKITFAQRIAELEEKLKQTLESDVNATQVNKSTKLETELREKCEQYRSLETRFNELQVTTYQHHHFCYHSMLDNVSIIAKSQFFGGTDVCLEYSLYIL